MARSVLTFAYRSVLYRVAYHLEYDEEERFTVGEPGYFWDARAALEGA